MTISNKPQDGEPIVEQRDNALSESESVPTAPFSAFLDEITNNIDLLTGSILSISGDFTTSGASQTLICRNTVPITITLSTKAITSSVVNIKRRGAQITVVGEVDGVTPTVINVLNYSMKIFFDGTEYLEI